MMIRYLEKVRRYSSLRFIVEMTLLALGLKILLLGFWVMVVSPDSDPALVTQMNDPGDPIVFFVLACLVGPPVETGIGQWLPIRIAQIWSSTPWIWITASTLLFGSMHLFAGLIGFISVIGPGIVFAGSFILQQAYSRWRAYWITSAIHALHNGISLGFYGLS